MQVLIWGLKCLLSILRCMLGSVKGVKSENPKGKLGNEKRGVLTKPPSAIHHHNNQTGHTTNQNNFQIIGREGHNLARNIKESIYIRVNNPTLNNNIGKFNLSHIWDRVLLNTKGLTLNNQSNNNNNQLTNPH